MINDRSQIVKTLNAQIHTNGHILGVAAGSGMTTKYSVKGGADIILALSAGWYRQKGRSSLASYLCYENSNRIVFDFATRELIPLLMNKPIIFGLHASDPTIVLEEYIAHIKRAGFAGVNNFPTVGLINGQFREALEEAGLGYHNEVEAIRIASDLGLFTLAFVFDEHQAEQMIEAGADVICVHLGLTTGGDLGAKKVQSIENARQHANRIFQVCDVLNRQVIKMVYGGPIQSPIDAQYFYDNTACQGYIGGSLFERIPSEKSILNSTKSFKNPTNSESKDILLNVLSGKVQNYDYVEFVKEHIKENYHQSIYLSEIALALHVSLPYLSLKFKEKMGCNFSEYLMRYRMNKAAELLMESSLPIVEIANLVGYPDYAQFSKMFKKIKGSSPRNFRKNQVFLDK
ncbi:AraC family transcriptional regulator [Ureibacillus massiliensis 4400831 = CIP 108448 = CCUG 49529]|uniref:AraC family transcriptional regulator n=1 Tax=Ureibacillus massiliensis 4400831 = CIP 108448 = CCUG 49529 TaxID=1211035 RepID=A0A0A3IJW9_9BACL|nr:phosphoenolpyruvate hydrolase family protein [Ureibacillus massiliensis]KGR83735.1 AraC family transcriptional regulator [Ureibacillus massiliensis 4400831 = CIP 108448 = CCUG 49529]